MFELLLCFGWLFAICCLLFVVCFSLLGVCVCGCYVLRCWCWLWFVHVVYLFLAGAYFVLGFDFDFVCYYWPACFACWWWFLAICGYFIVLVWSEFYVVCLFTWDYLVLDSISVVVYCFWVTLCCLLFWIVTFVIMLVCLGLGFV